MDIGPLLFGYVMIHLRVLGIIDLRNAQGRRADSVLAQSKRLALLAYLALGDGAFHRRDTLLGMLWPDRPERRARHALSQSLHVLRRGLDRDLIATNGDGEVAIERSRLRCDALELRAALRAGDRTRAVELYGGELLPGLHVAEAPGFERWLAAERDRFRSAASGAALALAAEALRTGAHEAAARYAARALEIMPYEERGIRLRMESLERLGERAEAVRAYAAFAVRLREELGVEPSPESRALADRIREIRAPSRPGRQPEVVASEADRPALPSTLYGGDRQEQSVTPATEDAVRSRSFARWRRRGLGLAVALTSVVVLARALRPAMADGPPAPHAGRAPLLVVPFENRTGDASLDPLGFITADWITQGLMELRMIPVVSSLEALRTSRAEDSGSRAGPSGAALLGRELEARTAVGGSYLVRSGELVFQAQVFEVETGEVLVALADVTAPLSDPTVAIGELRERLAGAVGPLFHERLAPWSPAASLPPSLEAYRLYAAGLDLMARGDRTEDDLRRAAEILRRAASLDSTFTAPLVFALYAEWNSCCGANDIVAHLKEIRHTLPPWDRAMADHVIAHREDRWRDGYLAARRARLLAGDRERAYNAAWAAVRGGYYRAAVDELESVEGRWLEERPAYWVLLSDALHRLGRCEEALEAVRNGRQRHPGAPGIGWSGVWQQACLGRVEAALADADRILRQQGWAASLRPLVTTIEELRVHGHPDAAHRLAIRGLDWYRRARYDGSLPDDSRRLAKLAALAGAEAEARDILESALVRMETALDTAVDLQRWARIDHRGTAGWLAARAGDTASARAALDWLREHDEERFRPIFPFWASVIHAELADRDIAIEQARRSLEHGYYGRPEFHQRAELDALRDDPRFDALIAPRDP